MKPNHQVTIALIEGEEVSSDRAILQLLRWRYHVVVLRPASLNLQRDLLDSAALLITTRTRWEIESMLGSTDHPPLLTSNVFDLRLRERIEAYLATDRTDGPYADHE